MVGNIGLGMSNPFEGTSIALTGLESTKLAKAGRGLATGEKQDIDSVSIAIGNSFKLETEILRNVQTSINYGSNLVKSAEVGTQSILKTLTSMRIAADQAANSTSVSSRKTLDNALKKQLSSISTMLKTTKFDDMQVLTGEVGGSDATITPKFDTTPVSVKSETANAAFKANTDTRGAFTLTFTVNDVAADGVIKINGVDFTAKAAQNADNLEFLNTADADGNAISFLNVFNTAKAKNPVLANYTATRADKVITFTQKTPSSLSLDVTGVAEATVDITTPNTVTKGDAAINLETAKDGDKVTINGVAFEAVTREPTNSSEFKVGNSDSETAINLLRTVLNYDATDLRIQGEIINDTTIKFTGVGNGDAPTITNVSGGIKLTYQGGGANTGIDLSGIKNMEGFINKLSTNFTAQGFTTGLGARAIASSPNYGNAKAADGTAAAAGDATAIYTATIDGKTFAGALFKPDDGTFNDATLKMTHPESGQYFIVNFAAAFETPFTTSGEADAIATTLNTYINGLTFSQSKTLKINTDKGDIIADGATVGSTKGVSARLTAASFENLQFKDFAITAGAAAGEVTFKATINDVDYTLNDVVVTTLTAGKRIDLKSTAGDTLSITLGETGLTALAPANFSEVATAFKDMLFNKGDGIKVRIGADLEDTVNIEVNDLSEKLLYRDAKGKYIQTLSLISDTDIKTAQEVISTAIEYVKDNLNLLSSESKLLENFSESLSNSIQQSSDAADSYLKINVFEESARLGESLRKMLSAIAAFQIGNRVASAAQRVVESLAQAA